MIYYNPSPTSMLKKKKLWLFLEVVVVDTKSYKILVGSLLFLSNVDCLDINYSISMLNRFIMASFVAHL